MSAVDFILFALSELEPQDWCLIGIIAVLLYATLREPILAARQQFESIDEPGSRQ